MLFKDYIRDKRVCIVGPAPYLKDLDSSKIDSYDVVIRLNDMYFIMDQCSYLGSKTDIIYGIPNKDFRMKLDPNVKRKKIKLGTIPPYRKSQEGSNSVRKKYLEFYTCEQVLTPSNTQYLAKYDGRSSFHLHTGMICIIDCIVSKPSELYLTGFTFFQTDDDYIEEYRNVIPNRQLSKKAIIGPHTPNKDPKLLKRVIQDNPDVNVVMDPIMKKIYESKSN